MSFDSVSFCLNISLAHASLNLKLDDELGTQHGLSFSDFTLLYLLSRAEGGRLPVADLVRPMGVQLSTVTRQLVRLEKMGLAERAGGSDGAERHAVLRAAGRRVLNEAMVTAEAICAEVLHTVRKRELPVVDEVLSNLRCAEALRT